MKQSSPKKVFHFSSTSPSPPSIQYKSCNSTPRTEMSNNMDTTFRDESLPSNGNENAGNGHHKLPTGLTAEECAELLPTIAAYHRYRVGPGQCSSLLSQRVKAPAAAVWSIVRRFDRPKIYKHFVRSCVIKNDAEVRVGCLREVSIISGLPASTSTERLDLMDEERKVTGFTIIGGEHRLRNYRSVTTVTEFGRGAEAWTVVLESYVVDVPEGNTPDDTRLFADTVVRLNLQKLAAVAETMTAGG